MEEFNLKESVGDSKPALKKECSKKKILIIILAVIVLIVCYLVGYIIGTKLSDNKKEDKPNNEIKEDSQINDITILKGEIL